MKKGLIFLVTLLALGAGGYFAYQRFAPAPPAPQLVTGTVSRGNVVQGIDATGRLEAVTTVQVGSQVSGTIKALYADFNSQVKRGQVVAELEPSLFQTQVEQAEATVVRARADLERSRVQLDDARQKLTRARDLAARQLLPQADLETAEANSRTAESAVKSAEAQLVQAQASLNQTRVNLSHTIITAPIDGVVISRNVDVGQTVAASMQAPTLFAIANDLTQMQVSANIDESDIGQVASGQPVTFGVDAYPDQTFTGTVVQVRLNPVIESNVVSYVTIISVPNPEMRLRPGMTANVTVEVARADNTLRVPASALRFAPTPELFASLGQPVPEAMAADAKPHEADAAPQPQAAAVPGAADAGARGGEGGGPPGDASARGAGDGRGAISDEQREAFRARLAQMSPEERQAMFAGRNGGRNGGGRNGGAGGGGGGRAGGGPRTGGGRRAASGVGQVWVMTEGRLEAVPVRTGISDGANVAVFGRGLEEGAVVATGIIQAVAAVAPAAGGNPLLPQIGRGRGLGGLVGGGGRGGGGNPGGAAGGRGQ